MGREGGYHHTLFGNIKQVYILGKLMGKEGRKVVCLNERLVLRTWHRYT